MDSNNFWNGKKVLITGVTGFIGSWMALWVLQQGGEVVGISRGQGSLNSNYYLCSLEEKIVSVHGDIRERQFLQNICKLYRPEVILHLAGQAINRKVSQGIDETLSANVLGTLNILECIKMCESVKCGVFVSSIKCYNENQCWDTPYIKSKGCSDVLIDIYRDYFFPFESYEVHGKTIINIVLENVIGGGDWGKNRLIPDCIKSIEEEKTIVLRNPHTQVYWRSIFEVMEGITICVQQATNGSKRIRKIVQFEQKNENYRTTYEMAEMIVRYYGKGKVGEVGEKEDVLNIKKDKVEKYYGFSSIDLKNKSSLDETVQQMVEWYKQYHLGNMYELCERQIALFRRTDT